MVTPKITTDKQDGVLINKSTEFKRKFTNYTLKLNSFLVLRQTTYVFIWSGSSLKVICYKNTDASWLYIQGLKQVLIDG